MSYDTHVFIDTGSDEPTQLWWGNMTCNIGPMYRNVMPGPYEGGGRYWGTGESEPCGGLPGISGLDCVAAASIISDALPLMKSREEELRAMEPSNGWGSYDGAVVYLEKILAACRSHPKGYLGVSW